jgi:hypothetical protein
MKRLLFFLLALLVAFTNRAGAEPDTAPHPDIRIEVQVIAVPESIAIPLVTEMKKKNQIEAANAKLQELIEKGVAKLVGWPIIITHSGQRAIYEAIEEIRYATEFSPAAVTLTPDVSADTTIKVSPSVDVTTFAATPTAFETRNAGVTLEVEPVLGTDGKTINLNIVPQHVRLKCFNKATVEGGGHHGKVVVEQPQFETNKITTSLTVRSGERVFLGAYPTTDPPKHLEFFILKAEVME